jgi:excisionase family DNA binding protein
VTEHLAGALQAAIEASVRAEVERRLAELRKELEAAAEREWLDAAACASWLSWPRKRVYRLAREGRMPHARCDGRLLFNRVDVRAWLAEHAAGRGAYNEEELPHE